MGAETIDLSMLTQAARIVIMMVIITMVTLKIMIVRLTMTNDIDNDQDDEESERRQHYCLKNKTFCLNNSIFDHLLIRERIPQWLRSLALWQVHARDLVKEMCLLLLHSLPLFVSASIVHYLADLCSEGTEHHAVLCHPIPPSHPVSCLISKKNIQHVGHQFCNYRVVSL